MNDVERALQALHAGNLVVLPTDTVYGIGALPGAPGAIESLFRAKGRAQDKPLPVLAATAEDLRSVVIMDERAETLAARFWPGPLTLVLPRAAGFGYDLGAGSDSSVAVRVPAAPLARTLLVRSGPLAVTSANVSGHPPATTVADARAALGETVAVYLDDGPAAIGEPSTVLSLVAEPTVLRTGAVAEDDLLAML